MVRVRPAEREDYAALLTLHEALYVTHFEEVAGTVAHDTAALCAPERVLGADLRVMLRDDRHAVFVAECDGDIGGYISGTIAGSEERILSRHGVIGDWFVRPSIRGKGVGRALHAAIDAWFRSHGCQFVESSTWADNSGARAAHAALGFDEVRVTFRRILGED